jgi:hypothetical protein
LFSLSYENTKEKIYAGVAIATESDRQVTAQRGFTTLPIQSFINKTP